MPKIMIVEDDKEYLVLYKEYLTLVGFEAITEIQSSKAIEVARATKPDLFILDLMMPEPDGFKLTRMIRTDPEFRRTPIIIITALNDLDSKLVALGSGANDYLTKPFHIEDLKLRIDLLLEKAEQTTSTGSTASSI
ncbi:MAG TPA: response regulator [Anaerolineales bacterium]|nr:response regulator [Anaerolineales bacterium]